MLFFHTFRFHLCGDCVRLKLFESARAMCPSLFMVSLFIFSFFRYIRVTRISFMFFRYVCVYVVVFLPGFVTTATNQLIAADFRNALCSQKLEKKEAKKVRNDLGDELKECSSASLNNRITPFSLGIQRRKT